MHRMPTGKLHIVPLGGLGEFGMNCMAVRWGDDIIVIDGGLMFPEAELLGVDIVVPDISYLIENRQRVKGIVLTHGHEDHIGALPWILSELNVPVWGTEFTLAYVEDKLEEHGLLDDADLREIRPGESFKIGPFTVNPIQVTHSLVDCVALAVHTPLGVAAAVVASEPNRTRVGSRLIAAAHRRALSAVGGSPSVVASKYRLRVRGSLRATASTKTSRACWAPSSCGDPAPARCAICTTTSGAAVAAPTGVSRSWDAVVIVVSFQDGDGVPALAGQAG